MGLSIAIAGAIVMTTLLVVIFTIPSIADKIFSIGDTTSIAFQAKKSISETDISMDHLSVLVGSPRINFTLNNDDSEKLWNFKDFDLIIVYDTASEKIVEKLSFSGECLGITPPAGNWCIQSIAGDLMDSGILNSGEKASIWTQANQNLASNVAIISVSTQNGVTASVSTTTCGTFCYQMIWDVYNDEDVITWDNKPAALAEFDSNDFHRSQLDLTDMAEWRLFHNSANGAGTAACVIGVQYSTDDGTTWRGLDNGLTGTLSTTRNSCNVSGDFITAWIPLNVTAKADVLLRIAGEGGDGVSDPDFGTVQVQFRS